MGEFFLKVEGLFTVAGMNPFRSTPGVTFDLFPLDEVPCINSIERVIHKFRAVSPGKVGKVTRPWYSHEFQDDHLVVLHGCRHVELYNKAHGIVERLTVYPDCIYRNNVLLHSGGVMLSWPRGVFHRIVSGDEGSASINLATHYPGYDLKNNFDIFDLNTETGESVLIRQGYEDQY